MNKTPDNENEVKAVKAWAVLFYGQINIHRFFYDREDACTKARELQETVAEVLITPVTRHSPQVEGEKKMKLVPHNWEDPVAVKVIANMQLEIDSLKKENDELKLSSKLDAMPDWERMYNEMNESCERYYKLWNAAQKELDLSIKLREGVEKEGQDEADRLNEIIDQLREKLERYEKALNIMSKAIDDTLEHLHPYKTPELTINRLVNALQEYKALSPQPIEPTVAESAKVQVSDKEALEWVSKNREVLKYDKELYYCTYGRRWYSGKTILEAIRSAMANEGKKD